MKIKKENVASLLDTRFIKVFDLLAGEGKHYYDATRRPLDDLTAVKSEEEFKTMTADAVTIVLTVEKNGEEPKLLMQYEFRYPCGRFILCPPAGLIDPDDRGKEDAALIAAKREIQEETGLTVKDTDRAKVVNPLLFSSPGMTDESNALVSIHIKTDDLSVLNNQGTTGMELFNGFVLLTRDDALKLIKDGKDKDGLFYSTYTWACLMWFISGLE